MYSSGVGLPSDRMYDGLDLASVLFEKYDFKSAMRHRVRQGLSHLAPAPYTILNTMGRFMKEVGSSRKSACSVRAWV